MRLAEFILQNVEPILVDWEAFARSITPDAGMDRLALRDHAGEILRAAARDMQADQTDVQRRDKSEGNGHGARGAGAARLDGASVEHAVGRVDSGFDLPEVVAEYRALRATVLRLWRQSDPAPDDRDLDDVTRFNESIDQSLTTAVSSYTERVERSRQLFLAILGHDLRGPLNAMLMSAELLKRTARLDADAAETARQISDSASAMGRMITDILDFTSASLGATMPVHPAPADLAKICQDVAWETCAAHPSRVIRVAADGDLTGEWDADRLRQVLGNLLGNAVQHGEGPIDVVAAADGEDVVLTVRNGGRPIPASALPTLFDPLVRGPSARPDARRRHGSLGLGLYIARQVVAAHGGTLDVVSTEAAGTTLTARLPRRRPSR
jgi:signal transduction histidine kinase